MAKIREEVDIDALPERVWAVVHEDLKNAAKWSGYVRKAEPLDANPPGKGDRVRYHLELPGGFKEALEVEQSVFTKPRRCAGKFIGGPLKGTWSYSYTTQAGKTHLTYEMDYELGGILRFAGGMLKGQYEKGIRDSMVSLKKYVEAGKGPKAAPAR
jgi:ligand-binding SRPBCC domain-containing protein